MTGAVYAGIVTVGAASLMPHPHGGEPGAGWYGFFVAVPVFAIASILIIPILRNRFRGELQRMSLGIVGFFCHIGWRIQQHLRISRQCNQRLWLPVLRHFRDGGKSSRRRRFHFRSNLWAPSIALRDQSEEKRGRSVRRARRLHDFCRGSWAFFSSAVADD